MHNKTKVLTGKSKNALKYSTKTGSCKKTACSVRNKSVNYCKDPAINTINYYKDPAISIIK